MRLVDYLHKNAGLYPEKTAAICGGETITWKELSEKVIDRASSFRKGQVVPFRSSQSIDFLITYFAIHQAGAVAAPLEKDIPENRFREIYDILSSSQVPDGTADILYTTGTTGKSKGVIISHRTIIADAENLILSQRLRKDDLRSVLFLAAALQQKAQKDAGYRDDCDDRQHADHDA